ncbi:MAG: response regulator [Candidatus Auribacterota bacterium]|nr:response regulator [Candidatus Auribacterota bacterium]
MFSKKILIIDDEKQIRELLSQYFDRLDFSVRTVSSGEKALEKVDTFIPNIILLDYMMPGVSGLDLFPAIKKRYPFAKVIILTGRGSEEIAVKALKMGVDDYITKPFELVKIRDLIRYYLNQQQDELVRTNGKYFYPLEDELINRYEFIRLAHSDPKLGVKTVSSFFSFTRQDFYNSLSKIKELGLLGLFGKRELKRIIGKYQETRLYTKNLSGFTPFPFLEEVNGDKTYNLSNFLNWNDPAQVRLEMIRDAATADSPHVGSICKKYGITREAFYQNYRAFEARGLFGILRRKKGRPRKDGGDLRMS